MSASKLDEIPSSYRDYEAEALEIVQKVIENAINIVKSEVESEERSLEQSPPEQPLPEQSPPERPPTIEWPCGRDFTVDKGKGAIQQLVDTWHIGSSWKCCIDYLNCQNDMHCYAVKYSEPTRRKPVPKATASVYFYIHIHEKDSPVLVKFIIEGHRTPLTPEDTVFHEVWLRNIIKNKLAISKAAQITC